MIKNYLNLNDFFLKKSLNHNFLPKKAQTSKNEKIKKWVGLRYPSGMGRPWKIFHWLFVPKFFPGFYTCILTPKKNLGEKPNVKFFTVARYLEVISEVGLCESAKNETFCLFWPRRGCPRVKIKLEPLSIWGEGYLIQRRWNFDPPKPYNSFFFFRKNMPF